MSVPRVLMVNNGTLSLPQLRRRIEDLGSSTETVDTSSVPSRLSSGYQAIVLSGTKVRAWNTEFYRPLVDLVMNSSVPVLGICGGMQLLAMAAGGRLVEGQQRVGSYDARVDVDEPLFACVEPTVKVFHRHTLYLDQVPTGFRNIGRSDQAPVEFMASDDGRIFGSQAHLEFRKDGFEILRGFTRLYG
ncbi:GMP synthase (glutamine-hydrolysing) [Actinopolyspora alba]|uniref:Glutamine amidotransferase n=1 Tax=Actinopolyspora alba TaxID=673379 RepID=A0A1I1VQ08_9ACTN|nr:gamma-glutamyl-gamma-aminobutyrate hydrolase family protein [Actinopolyspora alba]SFD84935.1 GMP synthase (glutamine-hydrolysing) [Actinopolyspora alba]